MTVDDLTLLLTRGVGSRTIVHLLDIFGTAEAIMAASADELVMRGELRPDVAQRIASREASSQAYKEVDYCYRHNIATLAATDSDYPEYLREVPDRPHVLFVQGNVRALSKPMISMVGTRDMSPSGQVACNRLIEGISLSRKDACIVSGLAYGIDAACHRAAITYGLSTVAVIASALPEVTPAPHRALANDIIKHGGAIVSELHSQSRQNGSLFIARNRIIAGLSLGTVVVESPASGGSLATADIADSYGRMVMAVPGRLTDVSSFGSNNLIRSGKARLVLTASDIIDDMGWTPSVSLPTSETKGEEECVQLTDNERKVYDVISGAVVVSLVELLNQTKLTIGDLSMVIVGLELKGLVRTLPGQRYEKI